MEQPKYTVSQFVGSCDQILAQTLPSVAVEGEVAEFKTSHDKWAFFNLKDENCSLPCFMPLSWLRVPLENGMQIIVRGRPGITKWGKFSLTVNQIMPVGAGSIKKAYEALKKKLAAEGLFAPERKRPLPPDLARIGVISSTGAAGYADFCKIINARWGGLEIQTCHTQVQGLDAPAQMIRALKYLNEKNEVQLIVIIRGGGSADDLACFNDEELAREIARSKIPVVTGIGHEVDESLADLVADLRASTPSNVAELITPDKNAILAKVDKNIRLARSQTCQALIIAYNTLQNYRENLSSRLSEQLDRESQSVLDKIQRLGGTVSTQLSTLGSHVSDQVRRLSGTVSNQLSSLEARLDDQIADVRRICYLRLDQATTAVETKSKLLERLNPDLVLKQGYSIVTGELSPGETVDIMTINQTAKAEIKAVKERK